MKLPRRSPSCLIPIDELTNHSNHATVSAKEQNYNKEIKETLSLMGFHTPDTSASELLSWRKKTQSTRPVVALAYSIGFPHLNIEGSKGYNSFLHRRRRIHRLFRALRALPNSPLLVRLTHCTLLPKMPALV